MKKKNILDAEIVFENILTKNLPQHIIHRKCIHQLSIDEKMIENNLYFMCILKEKICKNESVYIAIQYPQKRFQAQLCTFIQIQIPNF